MNLAYSLNKRRYMVIITLAALVLLGVFYPRCKNGSLPKPFASSIATIRPDRVVVYEAGTHDGELLIFTSLQSDT